MIASNYNPQNKCLWIYTDINNWINEKWHLFKTEELQMINEKGTKNTTKWLLGNYYSNAGIPRFFQVHTKVASLLWKTHNSTCFLTERNMERIFAFKKKRQKEGVGRGRNSIQLLFCSEPLQRQHTPWAAPPSSFPGNYPQRLSVISSCHSFECCLWASVLIST